MTEWQWALLDIVVVLVESVFLYYWYLSHKFQSRFSGAKKWVVMAVFPIAAYLLKVFRVKPSTTFIVLFVVGTIVVLVLYKCTIFQSFIWNILYIFMLMISEGVSKIFLVFLIFYYLLDGYFSYQARKRERLLVQMKNEKIISDYQALERSRQDVYQLYHDLKKHLSVIQMMDHKLEAEEYVEKCFESIQDIDGKFETGNQYMDMFLYSEWKKAHEMGVKAQFAAPMSRFSTN